MAEVAGSCVRTGVIALITLLAAAAAAPAMGAKADLSVTGVSGAPDDALTGEAPRLKVSVKNVGAKDSKKTAMFAQVLGADGGALVERFGKGSVGPTEAGRRRQVTFRPKVPYEAVGEWRLGVCVAPGKAKNDCAQTDVIDFADGSTTGRIDAALEAGDIDEGEALLYKLRAVGGDSGLPDEYDGGGPIQSGVVMAQLVSTFATLPDADQALVGPYMLQPRYAESAWAPPGQKRGSPPPRARRATDPCASLNHLNGAWSGIESSHAWFWYRPGNASAQAKAQSLSATFEAKVWPELTGAFIEVHDASTAICDPVGDSKIDFYIDSGNALLPSGAEGVAPGLHLGGPCGPNTSFVVLPQNAKRWTLAHEFMHVIQWAYRACQREPAWVEGTATWAGNYVYDDDQDEHVYKQSLTTPFLGLRDRALDYHSWPFWYSLEQNDDVEAIVRVYEGMGTSDFAGALEQGPSDGLEEAWKRYAVERWNQPPIGSSGFPVTSSFKQLDGFTAKPAGVPEVDVALGGQPEKPFPLTTFEQRPLSTWFHKAKISDQAVRELKFENADAGIPGTVVQAFLKLRDGTWKLEDWSDESEVTLCRDKDDEDVVEMVVATSNALATGNPLGRANHVLTAKDICEPPTYSGTFSGFSRFTGPAVDFATDFSGTMTLAPYDGPGASGREWEITGGSLNISSFEGTIGECTVEGGGSFSFPAFNQANAPAMALSQGRYHLNIPWMAYFPPQSLGVTWGPPGDNCEDADPEYPVEGVGQYLTLSPGGVEPDPDGKLITNDVSSDGDPNWEHDNFEFTFSPLP